jgi:hypothetical protein
MYAFVEILYCRILLLTVFINADIAMEHWSPECVKRIVQHIANRSLNDWIWNKIAEVLSDVIFAVSSYSCVKWSVKDRMAEGLHSQQGYWKFLFTATSRISSTIILPSLQEWSWSSTSIQWRHLKILEAVATRALTVNHILGLKRNA